MGHKSKFTFPIPGRFTKQTPTVSASNSMSKAEKILGTGGTKYGSSTATKEPGRSWETSSNGGISISISESSTSQSGVLDGDDDVLAGTTYGRTLWEEESEALPRRLRGAHGPSSKGLRTKKSAVTLGARSRDAMTDDTTSRRPQSSSTVYSYYESAKVPLAISQQTSNSAMAKGLPSKAGALLDIDGALYGKGPQKKKPTKLDFSKLRLRSRKDQNVDSHGIGPVLGNNYVMRSPSVMSHMSHTLVPPTSPGHEKKSRHDKRSQHQPTPEVPTRPGRLRGTTDSNTLHQLYDHYEQMSFRDAGELKEEDEEDEVIVQKELSSHQRLLPRTYESSIPEVSREDMVTPLPNSIHRDTNARWNNHSRNTSQASKVTATRAGTPSTMQLRPTSRNDYPASVSSRHTRTSKATPSIMSTMDSDRQLQSVLSLTDSDSEEEANYSRPGSSLLPSYENSFRDDLSVSSSQRQPSASRLSISSHSTNPKGASFAQLNDFLTIPHASPKAKNGRSPSTATAHSTNSSLSTATRVSIPSHQEPRGSVSTTGTVSSLVSPTFSNQGHFSVQEARAITFIPLASTAEATSSVSVDRISNNLKHIISPQTRQRMSQNSHASDQPTPPLSPTSVDFHKKSSESTRQEPTAATSEEQYNARLMAVTRQEEMLLAALRKKRARMRENIIAEIEEDRDGRGADDDVEKLALANLRDAEKQAAKETREARAKAKQPKNVPRRASSLMGRTGQKPSNGHGRPRDHSNGPRGIDTPPSTCRGDSAERAPSRMRMSPESETRSQKTGKARHERVLLYLDRPIDSIDVIDESEPSPDLSEFMDEEFDFPMPGGHRNRATSKPGNREVIGLPRPDSSPVSPKNNLIKMLPKAVPNVIEDIDADDFDDFEEIIPRRKPAPLQSVPEKGIPRPDSPLSLADGLLTPSVFGHKKSKKSAVRLSAVGKTSSPIPWWGDDD
ncbi:hypothetical protein F4804DRAFT_57972 [Jackrogersella minutella]|nr:hypothetical protein F4804DRAFT_57972 [Jackrogersella minutella]